MAVFETIQIYIPTYRWIELPRPSDFTPAREDVYAGEYTTCTGKLIGDRVGWKYADMVLAWDGLPESSVQDLLHIEGECEIRFDDAEGQQYEKFIRDSAVTINTRFTGPGNQPMWAGVSVAIRFTNTHTD